jgi:hypothetical protein
VLPDVPTFAEEGFPQLGMPYWYGLYAPAGLPAPVLARLHQAAVTSMADPALLARAEQQGTTIETQDVATFVEMNRSEFALGAADRRAGIRLTERRARRVTAPRPRPVPDAPCKFSRLATTYARERAMSRRDCWRLMRLDDGLL